MLREHEGPTPVPTPDLPPAGDASDGWQAASGGRPEASRTIRAAGAILLGLVTIGTAWSQEPPETAGSDRASVIFLVRHAEPVDPPPEEAPRDPPLNTIGQDRADDLARLLSSESVERVYSSDYRRTRETAAPIAARLGVEVTSYDPRDLPTLAATLLARPGRFLVVGHSNTTPQLVSLLGGDPGEPIDEGQEFDRLYVLSGSKTRGFTTVVLRYGDPLPENWRELADSRR